MCDSNEMQKVIRDSCPLVMLEFNLLKYCITNIRTRVGYKCHEDLSQTQEIIVNGDYKRSIAKREENSSL